MTNNLDNLKEELKEKEIIYNFIKTYDELYENLEIENIVKIIVLLIQDLEIKEEKLLIMLNKIFPDTKNWKEIIDKKYFKSKVKNDK